MSAPSLTPYSDVARQIAADATAAGKADRAAPGLDGVQSRMIHTIGLATLLAVAEERDLDSPTFDVLFALGVALGNSLSQTVAATDLDDVSKRNIVGAICAQITARSVARVCDPPHPQFHRKDSDIRVGHA